MDDEFAPGVYRLCKDIMKRYNTTPATAAECLEALTQGLLAVNVEPDFVGTWQDLFRLAAAEEEDEAAAADALSQK